MVCLIFLMWVDDVAVVVVCWRLSVGPYLLGGIHIDLD